MGKVIADFDAQLNLYRMSYKTARQFDQPDDAMHYAILLHSSLPKDIRTKHPLPQLKIDSTLRGKLNASSDKWKWCRLAMPIVERAISDHRAELLRRMNG